MLKDIFVDAADTLFLPGGGVGTKNLKACEELSKLLVSHNAKGGRIAAICAAPSALGILGILEGKNATCYPGFEDQLKGAKFKAIEFWFLLHGKDWRTKISTAEAYSELLKIDDCWAGYEKAALTDTQKAFLWKNRIEATERARRLKNLDNPSSGIFNLILALEKSLR